MGSEEIWRRLVMGEGLFQPTHLLVIALIALLIFGPKRLPELGKGMGEGIRALKHGSRNSDTDREARKNPDDVEKNSNAS
jgi:sec-independent protein translocase protein TatA